METSATDFVQEMPLVSFSAGTGTRSCRTSRLLISALSDHVCHSLCAITATVGARANEVKTPSGSPSAIQSHAMACLRGEYDPLL